MHLTCMSVLNQEILNFLISVKYLVLKNVCDHETLQVDYCVARALVHVIIHILTGHLATFYFSRFCTVFFSAKTCSGSGPGCYTKCICHVYTTNLSPPLKKEARLSFLACDSCLVTFDVQKREQ